MLQTDGASGSVYRGGRTKCELRNPCPAGDWSRWGEAGVHKQDTHTQARRPPMIQFPSVWQVTLIQHDYPVGVFFKEQQQKRGFELVYMFFKDTNSSFFLFNWIQGKGFWSLYSKEMIMGMRNDCKPTESSILSSLCLNCSCTDSTDYFTKVGMNFTLYLN